MKIVVQKGFSSLLSKVYSGKRQRLFLTSCLPRREDLAQSRRERVGRQFRKMFDDNVDRNAKLDRIGVDRGIVHFPESEEAAENVFPCY